MLKGQNLNDKWRLHDSLSQELRRGLSTDVHHGMNRHPGELVAVKMEKSRGAPSPSNCMLRHEYQVYQELGPGQQVPLIYDLLNEPIQHRGRYSHQHYMIMELLGSSLHRTMQLKLARPRLASSGLFFSLQEIAAIGIQMVSALEFVHSRHFIHQDLRPDHIVYGLSGEKVVLISFGKARRFRHATTLKHFPELMPGTVGSPIFTSVNSHHGHTLSRRDEMESLGYVLVYIFRGALPWQQLPHAANAEILTRKSSIKIEELCGGLEPLYSYFDSVKILSFEQALDYVCLRQKLETLAAWR